MGKHRVDMSRNTFEKLSSLTGMYENSKTTHFNTMIAHIDITQNAGQAIRRIEIKTLTDTFFFRRIEIKTLTDTFFFYFFFSSSSLLLLLLLLQSL